MMSRREALEYDSPKVKSNVTVGTPTPDPRSVVEISLDELNGNLFSLSSELSDLVKNLIPVLTECKEDPLKDEGGLESNVPLVRCIDSATNKVRNLRELVKDTVNRLSV